jgi:hypothetical protein
MRHAVLVLLAGILLAGSGSVVAIAAEGAGGPPLSEEQAAYSANLVEEAVARENEAVKATKRHRILTALGATRTGQGILEAAFSPLENRDGGADGSAALHAGEEARDLDGGALRDLGDGEKANEKEQGPLLAAARKKLQAALVLKRKLLTFYDTYTAPATTTVPPPASVGPLSACVFVTNNGSTSTENVHVRDPNGGGKTGSVSFTGQGVNQTNQITLDANGSAITSFGVSTFGTADITTMVGSQTASITFTLDTSNDTTTSDCP